MLVVFLPALLCLSVLLLLQKLHFLAYHDYSPTTFIKRFSYKEILLEVISIHCGCAASIFKYKKKIRKGILASSTPTVFDTKACSKIFQEYHSSFYKHIDSGQKSLSKYVSLKLEIVSLLSLLTVLFLTLRSGM